MEALRIAALVGGLVRAYGLSLQSAPQGLDRPRTTAVSRFVVISMQRSGTGLLDSALDSHPCISMVGEPFCCSTFWDRAKRQRAVQLLFDERAAARSAEDDAFLQSAPQQYLGCYSGTRSRIGYWSNASKTGDVRGFDWKMNQGLFESWPWFVEFCREHGVKILWLRRQNLLRQYISNEALHSMGTARRAAHAYTRRDARALRKDKTTLLVSRMLFMLERWRTWNSRMEELLSEASAAGVQALRLKYEDLVQTPELFDAAKQLVMGGSECAIPVRRKHANAMVKKVHKGSLTDLIENWDEVRKALQDTKFAWLLQDNASDHEALVAFFLTGRSH